MKKIFFLNFRLHLVSKNSFCQNTGGFKNYLHFDETFVL